MSSRNTSSSSSKASQSLNIFLLVLILAVAALLRFTALDLMEYKRDEESTVRLVSQLVDEGVFLIKAEPSLRGLTNSPIPVYLLAPVWAVSADPLVLTWWIAFLNVAAVGVTYWIGQRYLSPRAGLIAAACFAVSPWAVMFSRRIWRPDMMPLFQALLIVATLALVVEGRKRAIFWVCLLSGLLSQLYFPGYLAVGAVLLFLIIYRPQVSRPALILGLVALAVLFLPYGVFLAGGGWRELFQENWGKVTSLVHQVDWMWHLVNLGGFGHSIAETSYYLDAKLGSLALLLYPLAALERWIFIGGLGWLFWQVLRPKKGLQHMRPVGLLIILWIALTPLVCLFFLGRCAPRYYLIIYPAPFLVIGVVVDYGLVRLRSVAGSTVKYRATTCLAGLVLAGTLLTQVYFATSLFSILEANGGASGTYGVAYRHKVSLANHLAQAYGPGCYRLTHEWQPSFIHGVGLEIDGFVRRQSATKHCRTPKPAQFYVMEVVEQPLSPPAEGRLKPYRRFGPIFLYTKATKHDP